VEQQTTKRVLNYRTLNQLGHIAGMLAFGTVCVLLIIQYLTGTPQPVWILGLMAVLASWTLGTASWLILQAINERIVIDGNGLQWFDCFGRRRASVPADDKASYNKRFGLSILLPGGSHELAFQSGSTVCFTSLISGFHALSGYADIKQRDPSR